MHSESPDPAAASIPCPICHEPVQPDAVKCRWCGEWYGEMATRRISDATAATATAQLREPSDAGEQEDAEGKQEEISQKMLRVDTLALEVGSGLAALADPEQGDSELLERLKHVRRRIAMEFGVIVPGVRVRPHPQYEPGHYGIRVHGDLIAEGDVLLTHHLGVGKDLDVKGVQVEHVLEPIYGSPAVWIPEADASVGENQGLQMYDPQDVVATHVAEITKQHLAEILSREEVAELLNMARQDHPMVVQELVPNMLALGQLRQVLQRLVSEQIPIKNLGLILNALADHAIYTKDPVALAEHVRRALGRKITARYVNADGALNVIELSPRVEQAIQNAIQLKEAGQVLVFEGDAASAICDALLATAREHRDEMPAPVVLVQRKIRRFVRDLTAQPFPQLVVLSEDEVVTAKTITTLATVDVDASSPPAAKPKDWLSDS